MKSTNYSTKEGRLTTNFL